VKTPKYEFNCAKCGDVDWIKISGVKCCGMRGCAAQIKKYKDKLRPSVIATDWRRVMSRSLAASALLEGIDSAKCGHCGSTVKIHKIGQEDEKKTGTIDSIGTAPTTA
jgi:hypothetical protein